MPTEVIFPKVDMDMATGQISRWFYKEGDVIRKGEPLFEMETDKAAMEIDAPASGTLRNVTGVEGTDIAVGAPVAWIYAEGEAVDDAIAAPDTAKPQVVGPDPDVELDARPADAGAVQALQAGRSLLAAGVRAVEGEFRRGDTILVLDEAGHEIARGLIAYDAAEAREVAGLRSQAIEAKLGVGARTAMIHRDDLAMSRQWDEMAEPNDAG